MLSNDELLVQLREKDKAYQEQEERIKEMERKFEDQEKRYKSQEKRVQDRNKKIKELKTELESNEVELDADHDVLERLRAQKRELQSRIDTLTVSLDEHKARFVKFGLRFEEQEVEVLVTEMEEE